MSADTAQPIIQIRQCVALRRQDIRKMRTSFVLRHVAVAFLALPVALLIVFVLCLVSRPSSDLFFWTFLACFSLLSSLVVMRRPHVDQYSSVVHERALRNLLRNGGRFGILLRPFDNPIHPSIERALRSSTVDFFTLDDFGSRWQGEVNRIWVPSRLWESTVNAILPHATIIVLVAPETQHTFGEAKRFGGLSRELSIIRNADLGPRLLVIVDQRWKNASDQGRLNEYVSRKQHSIMRDWYFNGLAWSQRRRLRKEMELKLRAHGLSLEFLESHAPELVAKDAYRLWLQEGRKEIPYLGFIDAIVESGRSVKAGRWIGADDARKCLDHAINDLLGT